MKRNLYPVSILILLFISFKTDAQVLGVSECFNENDAIIGLDRKGWTSQVDNLSESYQIDFQIPEEPPFDCYEIDYVDISIDLSVNQNDISADCFLGYWTHVLNCEDHDPIGCPTDDIFFDMMGLNSSIILTQDLANGTTLGIDVVVLTDSNNPACSQTPISDGDYSANLEICVDVYYVPKEIDEEIDLGDDITLCPGATIDLEGPNGFEEYSWNGPVDSDEQLLEDAVAGEYTLDVFDADGCRISDDIIILEEDAFNISLDNSLPINLCEGGDILLTAIVNNLEGNPDFDYTWFQGQNILSNDPSFNFSQEGNYNLIVSSSENGCEQNLNFTIDNTSLSSAQIGSIPLDTILLCQDSILQLNAFVAPVDNNNYSFEWIALIDTLIQDSLLVSEPGLYILNQYNDLGCPASSDSIYVEFIPSANAGADNAIDLCQGSDFDLQNLLSAEASNNGMWESAPPISGLPSGTLMTSDLNPGMYTLTYIVEGTVPCPSDTSTHIITILDAQIDAGDDASIELCNGEQTDLSSSITGNNTGIFYTESLTPLSNTLISSDDLNEGDNLFYYVVESQQCNNDTAQIIVSLLPDPGITLIQGPFCTNYEILIGSALFNMSNPSGRVVLSNASGCDSIIDVNLQFFSEASEDLAIELCEGESFDYQGQTFDESNPSGSVTLPLSSQNGCDSIVNVTVSFASVLSETLTDILCSDEQLEVNGIIYDISNPTGSQNLQSVNGCDSLLNIELMFLENTDSLLMIEICSGESITVNGEVLNESTSPIIQTLINSNGCDSLLTVEAILLSASELSITDNLCEGETLTIAGELFDSSNSMGQIILENMNQVGCDSIINVDLNFFSEDASQFEYELCEGDSIEINGTWLSDEGSYEDLYQNQNGCDSIVTSVISLIDCSINVNVEVLSQLDCFEGVGSSVEIAPGNNAVGLFYQLLNNNQLVFNGPISSNIPLAFTDLEAGVYEFVVIENGLPVSSDFFEILQPDQLVHNSSVENISCFNAMDGMANLDISGGTPPYEVLWSNGAMGTNLSQLSVGNYNYTISDMNDCQVFGNLEITSPTELDFDVEVQSATCDESGNGEVSIENINGGMPPYSFALNGSDLQTTPLFQNLNTGSYNLLVSDANDCTSELMFFINSSNNLNLEIPSSLSVTEGESLSLNASTNFEPAIIEWSRPELLSCNDCLNPVLTTTSSLSLTITVTDENGCSVSASIDIEVLPNFNNEIFIPNIIQVNAFSASNDKFLPLVSQESSIEFTGMRIYDRWGNEVYSENGAETGWDGRYNDNKVMPGVYVYQIEYLESGIESVIQGQLTVIR